MSTDTPRPFLDHLEELRLRLLYSLVAFAILSCVGYFYVDPILNWLAKPVGEFVFTTPTEAFFIRLKIAAGVGGIVGFPFILFQLWRFIDVALERKQRSFVFFAVPAASGLFYIGMALAVFGVAPIAVKFLLTFSSPALRPFISIEAYLSFLFWMIIGFGVLFQLPLIIVALCAAGAVQASQLSAYRRHIVVGIFLAAAILTPGPDFFSQLLLAVPAYLLFELSLLIGRRVQKPRPPSENGSDLLENH